MWARTVCTPDSFNLFYSDAATSDNQSNQTRVQEFCFLRYNGFVCQKIAFIILVVASASTSNAAKCVFLYRRAAARYRALVLWKNEFTGPRSDKGWVLSSGIYRLVVSWKSTDVSEEHIASRWQAQQFRLPHLLDSRLTDGAVVVIIRPRPPFTFRKIPGTRFY
jgi:hypothetical protein